MKRISLIIALTVLAGCGADGAPWQNNASLGLSAGSDGVNSNASFGASNGPVSVGVSM